MSENPSQHVNYLLQCSLGEMVAERDKLIEVCQPFYEWVEGDRAEDITALARRIHGVMKKYNRKK
jgi:hypothetical protein